MYGLLLNAMVEYLEDALGADFQNFVDTMEVEQTSFIDLCNYDDAIFFDYVKKAAEFQHTSQYCVMQAFGSAFPSKIHMKTVFNPKTLGPSFPLFFQNLGSFHYSLTVLMPEMKMPRFALKDVEEFSLRLLYTPSMEGRSAMQAYVKGLILRVGQHFGVDPVVKQESAFDPESNEPAVFFVEWKSPNPELQMELFDDESRSPKTSVERSLNRPTPRPSIKISEEMKHDSESIPASSVRSAEAFATSSMVSPPMPPYNFIGIDTTNLPHQPTTPALWSTSPTPSVSQLEWIDQPPLMLRVKPALRISSPKVVLSASSSSSGGTAASILSGGTGGVSPHAPITLKTHNPVHLTSPRGSLSTPKVTAFPLPAVNLQEMFPFHIITNSDLVICQIGRTLNRIVEHVAVGKNLSQIFKLVEPPGTEMNLTSISAAADSVFILEDSNLVKLKGQMTVARVGQDPEPYIYFLCSPRIDSNMLSALTPEDFSAVDASRDNFILRGVMNQMLDDAVLLQDAVRDLNKEKAKVDALLSELMIKNQELQKARDDAELATETKSRFIAQTSHELRTPLNGIMGMTALLMDTPLNSHQRQLVKVAYMSGEALLRITNDILDISKIESGKLSLEKIPFNLVELIEDVMDTLSFQASKNNIELCVSLQPDVPAMIIGDPGRLRQVLLNLMGNALKFTSVGSVAIHVAFLSFIEKRKRRPSSSSLSPPPRSVTSSQTPTSRPSVGTDDLWGSTHDFADTRGLVVAPRTPLSARLGLGLRANSPMSAVSSHSGHSSASLSSSAHSYSQSQTAGGSHSPESPGSVSGAASQGVGESTHGSQGTARIGRRFFKLQFRVVDTGSGIPQNKIQGLFEPYVQADASTTRTHGGTGLGLTISRQLVKLFRGEISAKSEVGEGSEFIFDAEFGSDEIKNSSPFQVVPLTVSHVVIFSKHPLVGAYVRLAAVRLRLAVSPAESLSQLEEIVLRLNLKNVGSVAVIVEASADEMKLFLARNNLQIQIKFIQIRGYGEFDRDDPFVGILTKPIRQNSVTKILTEIASTANTASRNFPAPTPKPMLASYSAQNLTAAVLPAGLKKCSSWSSMNGDRERRTLRPVITIPEMSPAEVSVEEERSVRKMKVLIVDDNPINMMVAMGMVRALGVTADKALNGQEAIDLLTQGHIFDIILMDVHMPVLDGIAATRIIRSMPLKKQPPIVALTAASLREEAEECKEAGMNCYLGKPFTKNQLRDILNLLSPAGVEPLTEQGSTMIPPTPVTNFPGSPILSGPSAARMYHAPTPNANLWDLDNLGGPRAGTDSDMEEETPREDPEPLL